MVIKVKELCWVSYIKEEDMEKESDEKVTAVRTVIYNSPKDTILEAFQDYDSESFDCDNIIQANDEFEGECLDLVKYISVEEVEEY